MTILWTVVVVVFGRCWVVRDNMVQDNIFIFAAKIRSGDYTHNSEKSAVLNVFRIAIVLAISFGK